MAELRAQARAFADAWAPGASATAAVIAAARAAGYAGDEAALRTSGLRLLRDERVRARIEARLGRPIDELLAEAKAAAPPPAVAQETPKGLVKGRGRGTATERIEIAMALARSKKVDPKDRLDAVELAAELEGELRRGRGGAAGRPALPVPEPAPAPRPAGPPRLQLVTNDLDAERGR